MTEQKKHIKRFFKHSYIYAIGNIINRVGAFLLLPVYTNYLTVEEYGALELFYSVSMVVFGFLSVGMAHATLRFYFEYDNDTERHAVVSTNYIASFILSIVGVLLVGVWYKEITILVFSSAEYSAGILVILATIVFELSSQICLAYVRAIEKSMLFVYISIAKLIVQVSLNVYLVIFAGKGVVGVLTGNLVAVFLGWVVLTAFTLRACGVRFHYHKLIVIFKYSLPFLLGTFTALISSNVDKFGLNYLDTIGAVGIYMLAIKFSMIIEQLVGEPFSRSYGSFRFSIMKKDNAAEIQASIVRYLFYATVLIALGISLFIKDLLMVMSDKSYWYAADIVPIVMLASIIKIMSYPAQTGVLYAKKTKYIFYVGVVAAVISVAGNLLMIPFWGILGACAALIMTDGISLILTHRISQKYFHVKYDYFKMISALFLAIITFAISLFITTDVFYISIPLKLVLALIYVLLIVKIPLFLSIEERKHLFGFVSTKILRRT